MNTADKIMPLAEHVQVGQRWVQLNGSGRVVVIRGIEDNLVLYGDHGNDTTYSKQMSYFQNQFRLIPGYPDMTDKLRQRHPGTERKQQ